MKLKDKSVIITGSSQGFGLAVAEAFANEGAHIAMCARGEETLYEVREELRRKVKGKTKIIAMPGDVSRQKDMENIVSMTLKEFNGVDVLLCNAGVYGPKGRIEDLNMDDWARAVEINIMGTILPCHAVLPIMKKHGKGKIIIMSGGGATKPLPFLSAYAASKAAVVRFAETLAEEVEEDGIYVNAVAPGVLDTRMLDEVLLAGPKQVGEQFYAQMVKVKEQGGTPFEVGISLCVFLASDESDGINGKLISAVWDPWEKLMDHLDELQKSDIYTLRRIVPKDRSKYWGDKDS